VGFTLAVVFAVVVALATGVVVAVRAHRARAARDRRRLEVLTQVAARIDEAVSSLGEPTTVRPFDGGSAQPRAPLPAPLVDADLGGRAALVEALAAGVAGARTQAGRLAAAVVRTDQGDATTLARDARSVADVPVFVVGPRAVALVLPGLGRADALGLLARIEAQCPSSGRAVELEPDEDALELAARLLWGWAPGGAQPPHHA